MATLYDSIKATADLIAYWPLHIDGADHSGNGRPLTVAGTVSYAAAPLTNEMVPSVLTPNTSGTLRIEQATLPKIKAVEGMFRLAGAKGGGVYSTAIGLSQPLTGFNNRYIMLYHDTLGFCSYQSIAPLGGNNTYPSASNNWDKLSIGAHHYVVQLNAAETATEVYIDGVKDDAMTVPLDVFLQAAGLYLTVGAYYYNGGASGNGQTCDVAIYGRPLTPAEIADRQQYRLGDPVITAATNGDPVWGNQETQAEAAPQLGPKAQPIYPDLPITPTLAAYDGMMMILPDGRSNRMGYIESTVTIDGEGVRRRVLCFTQSGDLVAETMSRASDGKYRFDSLWLNRRYMLVAQDDPAFGPADYNAVAADYQLPTPYAPGEGVGLTGG